MSHSISQKEIRTKNWTCKNILDWVRNVQCMLWPIQRYGTIRFIKIYHIILPCRKMRISLHERTRRATSMVRRGNLFLFLSPSFPSEEGGWKSNMQMLLPSRNMEKEHKKWKFDFRREEKYRYASQATLQMSSNEFRIFPYYSYNGIATTGLSNLFINQKVSQPEWGTRRNWNCCRSIHMLNLGQHPITKISIPSMPTFKQYMLAIQLQSLFTLCIPLTSNSKI